LTVIAVISQLMYMKQFSVPETMRVVIDFENGDFPEPAKKLRPVVIHHGQNFSCVLGPDLRTGIVGHGESAELAIEDWNKNLNERISLAGDDDKMAAYIVEVLGSHTGKASAGHRQLN
jgi:hypothetical protein